MFNFLRKKQHVPYPNDFGIIDWTPLSLSRGLKGNRNKIIYRYFINHFGNRELKKYRYSEERVQALIQIHRIPIFDKTRQNPILPIYAKILPGEASYTK